MRERRGFTLVELMIVVVIIGILSSLAIARYKRVVDRARIAEATLWCNRIAKAIETMGAETGEWPGHTPAGFVCAWPHNEVFDFNTDTRGGMLHDDPDESYPGWAGPYLSRIPVDPWGSPYCWDSDYLSPDGHEWVAAVVSWGPNKIKHRYDEDNIIVILSVEELPDEYYDVD